MSNPSIVAKGRTTTVRLHRGKVILTPRWWAWFMRAEDAPRCRFPAALVSKFEHEPAGWVRLGSVYFDLTFPPDGEEQGVLVKYGWGARREFDRLAKAFRRVAV